MATGKESLCWMPRQMYLPSSLWGFKTTWGEIQEVYNKVYQQKMLPGSPLCGAEGRHKLAQDILTSLEEHLQQRWGASVLEGGQEHRPARTPMPHYSDEAPQRRPQKDDSCDHTLAQARDAHWWVMATTHLLEEQIERLSQSARRMKADIYWHSHSRGHLKK